MAPRFDTLYILLYTPLYRYVDHVKATLEETVGLVARRRFQKRLFCWKKSEECELL